jgi:N-acetylmuramoyl-L-alanine amidase
MSFLARAVFAAASVLSLAGLATSTPGLAAEAPSLTTARAVVQPLTAPQGSASADEVRTAVLAPDAQPGEQVAYPTLAAAVAAQDSTPGEDEALRCLAGAIYFESRGEPLAGQLAVAKVILNRAASGRFRSSVCGVVTQPGQFSFVRGGEVPAPRAGADYRTALAVAQVALNDAWDGEADEALYFNGRRVGHGGRVRLATIGNHAFYR